MPHSEFVLGSLGLQAGKLPIELVATLNYIRKIATPTARSTKNQMSMAFLFQRTDVYVIFVILAEEITAGDRQEKIWGLTFFGVLSFLKCFRPIVLQHR